MPTLRLTQHLEADARHHRVELSLEGHGGPRRTAVARFAFALTPHERERVRWYLEDYLEHPYDPAPQIAARAEATMVDVGARLFSAVFRAKEDTRDLWSQVRHSLDELRLEIASDVAGEGELPWELLHDPHTQTYLPLQAATFVRTHSSPARTPELPTGGDQIRILLAICRPRGRADVPFRSVAVRIIKALSEGDHPEFALDVLRPATFEQLARVLRDAAARGTPYHVLHFDGHGEFLDLAAQFKEWEAQSAQYPPAAWIDQPPTRFSPGLIYPHEPRTGERGYLLFENPGTEQNLRLVDGPELGTLLRDAGVPVLVLNACRSARAGTPPALDEDDQAEAPPAGAHEQVRAFGSLALEVMDAGVAGVVAMRYNVYVVTAAQFVADLYAALTQGHSLGRAATMGRKQLHASPLRAIAHAPRPLQDWCVPVVYEAAPLQIFPTPTARPALRIKVIEGDAARASKGALDPALPPRPDAGFFGRDEVLLAVDRALDSEPIVLLHGYAGSGKTVTAGEFARWFALTGGVDGPVLFTSFETYTPLARALDQIDAAFGPALAHAGVQWLALSDEQRVMVALDVLRQIPVLWIWDNVEPVAGFPAVTGSQWARPEQGELADFLRAARETKAKFLLTSRRDERAWLGKLPRRVAMPPMPMRERVQLAQALAKRYGRHFDVAAWWPLLEFTQGNPLTLTVVVGQALRDGLQEKNEIEAFVGQLRAGEAVFEDEAAQGRSRSLGASLAYGFERAFSDEEREVLALLHLFQGFVDVNALVLMGHPEVDWCLDAVSGITDAEGIHLLDRAVEVGLLRAHGEGYYSIHPALPWFFRRSFEEAYRGNAGTAAERAYVRAVAELGNLHHRQYQAGDQGVIPLLAAEEANLLHARRLARARGWWPGVIMTMQGLRQLYDYTGRRAAWARLVEEILPDFVDPASGGPRRGREEDWGLVTEYRVRLAREARRWDEAQQLQEARVAWERERAAQALTRSAEALDATERQAIRALGTSLHELGEIRREQGDPACVTAYEEAVELAHRIGDRQGEATCALNLGHTYSSIPALRDLDQAERWYRRSLELRDPGDRLGRAKVTDQIGMVQAARFREARDSGAPEEELQRYANAALEMYQQALALTPPDALVIVGLKHQHLGNLLADMGQIDRALGHYQEAIRAFERGQDRYFAATTRWNVAVALVRAGRRSDALAYARTALRNFQTFGAGAAAEVQETQELIAAIEELEE
jgi:tetratricopeptide (TPR) repeat protein